MGEDRWGRNINQQTFHRHNGKDLPEGTLVLEPPSTAQYQQPPLAPCTCIMESHESGEAMRTRQP